MTAASGEYRLRQIALVAKDCDPVADAITAAFGARIAFRDPEIIHYGLRNAVLPLGRDFIEIVAPVTPDASAGRYLQRRGAGGYMVILQAESAAAHRDRLRAAGAQVVDVIDTPRHAATHFHPRTFGGVLVSIDSVPGAADWRRADSDWDPAGRDWRAANGGGVHGIAAIEIASDDPAGLCATWAALLALPIDPADPPALAVRDAMIRFVTPRDDRGTGIHAVDIAVDDPAAVIANARRSGLSVSDTSITIGGMAVRPVAAG